MGSPPLQLFRPSFFPSRDLRIRQSNILALFWNDHDLRNSSIFYEVFQAAEQDVNVIRPFSSALAYVSSFISHVMDIDFVGTWMLVAHWQEVKPFPFHATNNSNVSINDKWCITDRK